MQPAPIDLVMRALADPTRRMVYQRLASEGEASVAALTSGSGVTQGAVSQHLKLLKQAGLVAERPEGRHVFYRARPEGLSPLLAWIDAHTVFWRDRFADLRDLLEDLDE